jgi:Family of unknown function (DUF6496)
MPSSEVMHKYKAGRLRSGGASGPLVQSRKQAIAIKLSEERKEKANGGVYPEPTRKPRRKQAEKKTR